MQELTERSMGESTWMHPMRRMDSSYYGCVPKFTASAKNL